MKNEGGLKERGRTARQSRAEGDQRFVHHGDVRGVWLRGLSQELLSAEFLDQMCEEARFFIMKNGLST